MEQRILSIFSVACITLAAPAIAGSFEVPLPALFQYSPNQLGRSVSSARTETYFAPHLIFKKDIVLNQVGAASLGDRCSVVAVNATDAQNIGYFNSHLNVAPGGKIADGTSYEMRLISFQPEVLKVALVAASATQARLELTCTHPAIQTWTVSEFESKLNQAARVHASAKLAKLKQVVATAPASQELNTLRGSLFNGVFGSGLPGTMGIQLLLGANLKAYAEESNAKLMVGKRCKLLSQKTAAYGDSYLKGSKFAFREYRVIDSGKTELVFDNWNHSPHQVRVECRGDLDHVKQMTVAEVEHDLNGTIAFYRK